MTLALDSITYRASSDGTDQPARLLRSPRPEAQPLLVALHTWSADWQQNLDGYFEQAQLRQWHAIEPNFRGPNRHPDACGSAKAMQDIVDAINWAKTNLAVNPDRVYLAGGSGGGHMTLQTVCHHPEHFAAASAWCAISDLTAWHTKHCVNGVSNNYARDIEQSVHGRPGDSPEVDAQLRARSPRFHITGAAGVPVDINHGVHDGKKGSVPFVHSIWAFNALAEHHGQPAVSAAEIDQLDQQQRLTQPQPQDQAEDASYGRAIYLRRQAGLARLTIFEGGHDALPAAAVHWLAQHGRGGQRYTDDCVSASAPGATPIGR